MKKLTMLLLTLCVTASLAVPASAVAMECVNANSISLALPQAAGLAHFVASPFPTKSTDFAGTLIDGTGDPEYGKPTSIEVIHTVW